METAEDFQPDHADRPDVADEAEGPSSHQDPA